ncbi:hypothetical protein [Pinirhizobacter sp.]|jgi:hypothetical protein|uniref:hypothetical protein n=1 Tax=Pinirhizobacter sp. TaxID=2950432 RepID=UPI002F414709
MESQIAELTSRIETLQAQVNALNDWDGGLWRALLDVVLVLRERDPASAEALLHKWAALDDEYSRGRDGETMAPGVTVGFLEPRVTMARVVAQLSAATQHIRSDAVDRPQRARPDGAANAREPAERHPEP